MNSTIFSAALPSSSIFTVSPRGGGSLSASTVVFEPVSPTACVHAELGDRHRPLRLRPRAHDPLQRRVARLVDRVRDGERRPASAPRSRRSRTRSGACRDLSVGDRRARRPARSPAAEAGRRRRPRARRRPSRSTAGRRGSRSALSFSSAAASALRRRDEVGARCRLVRDQQRLVGAHRERLANRVLRAGRAHESRSRPRRHGASLIRSASSTAWTSNGLIAPRPNGRAVSCRDRSSAARSGTCLTQTAIFTARDSTAASGATWKRSRQPALGCVADAVALLGSRPSSANRSA